MSSTPHPAPADEADPELPGPASAASGPSARRSGLVLSGVTKRFGQRTVVKDVDVELAPGEVLALVGPNGTGKTTLMRMMAGSLEPDEGTITWCGRPVDESDPQLRAQVAALLDDTGTFPDLSVAEHLELLARAFSLDDPTARVAAVLADVGLNGREDQLPVTLSSGQRHRLALASVLVRPAALVLLDEPEQRLDVAGRAWLSDRLLALAAAGAAVVLVSHDEELVEQVADLLLDLG